MELFGTWRKCSRVWFARDIVFDWYIDEKTVIHFYAAHQNVVQIPIQMEIEIFRCMKNSFP